MRDKYGGPYLDVIAIIEGEEVSICSSIWQDLRQGGDFRIAHSSEFGRLRSL